MSNDKRKEKVLDYITTKFSILSILVNLNSTELTAVVNTPKGSVSVGTQAYVIYSIGVCITNIGTWMQKVGIGWLTWELTHSAVWVGAITLGDLLAALLVTPLAGAVADRCNPYRFFQLAQVVSMIQATFLWGLAVTHYIDMTILMALTIVLSIIQGFSMPVGAGMVAKLATHERLAQAVASNAFAINIARAIGPALAGIAITHGNVGWVFAGNAISYFLFLGFLYPLRFLLDVTPTKNGTQIVDEIVDGFKYVVGTPRIRLIFIILFVISLLLRPVIELLPAFAGGVLRGDAATLSILETTFGLGGVIGGFAMLWLSREKKILMRLIFYLAMIFCISVFTLAVSPSLSIVIPAIALVGISTTTCAIGIQSLVQLSCEHSLRGRILSLYQLVFRGMPPLGAFVIGLFTQWSSLTLLIAFTAITAASMLLYLVFGPVRALDVAIADGAKMQ